MTPPTTPLTCLLHAGRCQADARNLLSSPNGRPPLLLCFVAAGTLTGCSSPARRCSCRRCCGTVPRRLPHLAFADGRPTRSRSRPGGLRRPWSRLLRIFPPPLAIYLLVLVGNSMSMLQHTVFIQLCYNTAVIQLYEIFLCRRPNFSRCHSIPRHMQCNFSYQIGVCFRSPNP